MSIDPRIPNTLDNNLHRVLEIARLNVPFYRERAPRDYRELGNWPLVSKSDLEVSLQAFLNERHPASSRDASYVVASGGSTATPVYVSYAQPEVEIITRNLAFHFEQNGMQAGDSVVNYFGAGDMCGAFSMVDRSLAHLPVTILPLSFTPNLAFALEVIQRFHPNAIVGIPTLLVHLARYSETLGHATTIEKVYYGGEIMTAGAEAVLRSIWKSKHIRSAGYASTEAGAIGWQCLHCEPGEHFAFHDNVVEIVDNELVVTSLSRTRMPLIRYRTGDRGVWCDPHCHCGNGAPMFKLLGRLDTAMILWGCWMRHEDIVTAFHSLQIDFTALQVELSAKGGEHVMNIRFESPASDIDPARLETLRERIYELSADLNQTFPMDQLRPLMTIQAAAPGTLRRNQRTGKVIPVIDSRI